MTQQNFDTPNGMGAWRLLSHDQNKLLLKLNETEDFSFFVTDLTKIWHCTLCKTAFIKLLNDSNKLLYGFDSKQLLDMALDVLKNDNLDSTRPHVVIDSSQNTLMFRIRSQKDDCPVTIKVELQLGNAEMFYSNVTIPLLKSIQDLKTSQDKLLATISKKDREIDDYKQEGAKLGLKYLKTPIFDISGHNEKHSTLSRNFESVNFIESAISRYKENEASAAKIKLENSDNINIRSVGDVKLEPSEVKSEEIKSGANANSRPQVKEEMNFHPSTRPCKKPKKRGLQF